VDSILPRDYFSESMVGVHVDIDTFNSLAHNVLPRLMMTLDGNGIMVDMFLSKWMMSLFIGSMQPATTNRVLDIIFYDGSHLLFQIILGMLKTLETEITRSSAAAAAAGEAFEGLDKLAYINVADDNNQFESISGVLFHRIDKALIKYPSGRYGSYDIPYGTRTVGNRSFAGCTGLTDLSIPGTVEFIEDLRLLLNESSLNLHSFRIRSFQLHKGLLLILEMHTAQHN